MIKIRPQEITDAEKFCEILHSPKFIHFNVHPPTLEEEQKWLSENEQRRKNNTEWNFTIINDEQVIGAIGVKINFHRNYIGEIGYFLDPDFWGRGIATQAVKILEDICFKELNLTRLEIVMLPENLASEKVAIKNNYLKEGLLRKHLKHQDGSMRDVFLYAKTV